MKLWWIPILAGTNNISKNRLSKYISNISGVSNISNICKNRSCSVSYCETCHVQNT